MDKYVRLDDALNALDEFGHFLNQDLLEKQKKKLCKSSVVNITPKKYGHWITDWYYHTCSECGFLYDSIYGESNFCPNCGIVMDNK